MTFPATVSWLFAVINLLIRSSSGLHITSKLPALAGPSPLYAATQDLIEPDRFTLSEKKSDFSSFDYYIHWYPVAWARDLPIRQPSKVTIFDVDYVVAKVNDDEVVAMLDRCPHKSAALSEGRVTSAGFLQCAYHGWSFNGKDGACEEIPQIVKDNGEMVQVSSRACGTAIPAQIVQGMVYLFPGGNLEKALLAPSPPKLPELDEVGWKTISSVRDFPVDWTILIENILDPDHGLFAHQAVGFDLYSASTDAPQTVVEKTTDDGKGWTIISSVEADYKLLRRNDEWMGKMRKPPNGNRTSYSTFVAPSFAYSCRRDKHTGETNFITTFHITPTGTGRSRFMSNVVFRKVPLSLPRWVPTVSLLNFLDQDTYLLASQQPHVLACESEAVKTMTDDDDPATFNSGVRRRLFAYRSPSERMSVRIGAFWDQTLSRVPNRVEFLRNYKQEPLPPRSVVLDREVQHLNICPDSQGLVRTCKRLEQWCTRSFLFTIAAKAWVSLVAHGSWASWANRKLLGPTTLGVIVVVSTIIRTLAERLRREYFFKYTTDYRDLDLRKIPSVWRDKSSI